MEAKTYEQFLQSMEQTYLSQAGFVPQASSDLGIRLRVLAGELANLSGGLVWLQRQAFPQTASGTYLEEHAQQKGLTRRQATAALGSLTFSRASALNYALPIPAGTVCAPAGDTALRYVTTEAGSLPAGETAVTLPAMAEQGGSAYNTAEGAVSVMLTPPAGIESVTGSAFVGGADTESDAQLRSRLLLEYAVPGNGTNCAYYEAMARSYPGVHSAQAVPVSEAGGAVTIYVCGKEGALDDETMAQMQADFNAHKEINVTVQVQAPTEQKVNFGLYITPADGRTYEEVSEPVRETIRSYIRELQLGQSLYVGQVVQCVMDTGLIKNWSLYSASVNVHPQKGVRLMPNTILTGKQS